MAGQMRMFDIGSVIRVTVIENGQIFNASGAIGKTFKLKPPSGDVKERPAEFQTDGTNGVIQYITVNGDLDESGPWTGQVFLDFAPDAKWHTEPFNFHVAENLS